MVPVCNSNDAEASNDIPLDSYDEISQDDADTAVRVLQHILDHGVLTLPGTQGAKLMQLTRDICAGRGVKNKNRILARRCYICRRQREYAVRPGEPPLCTECNSFNAARRKDIAQPHIFEGKITVVTGGRINLGYAVALALLRGGASCVIITTRFPDGAVKRYSTEPDYDTWSQRLHIVQADFTSAASIQQVVRAIRTLAKGRLDILINNAAQTVPIPDPERERLFAGEMALIPTNQHQLAVLDRELVTVTGPTINSWVAQYNQFSYRELLDVLAINAVVPFILLRECVDLMLHDQPTHIINVSSREGMFEATGRKQHGHHVHTNMAKAALNMMTQTLGNEFRTKQVYINAVDPGFLSFQHSLAHNGVNASLENDVPLTWADGAARVLNPVLRQVPISGAFFKDFKERDWKDV